MNRKRRSTALDPAFSDHRRPCFAAFQRAQNEGKVILNPQQRPSRPVFATIYNSLVSLPSLFSTTPKFTRLDSALVVTGSGGLLGDDLLSVRVLRLKGDGGNQGGPRWDESVHDLDQIDPLSDYEDSRSRRSRGLKRRSRNGEASPRRAGKGKGDEARRCVHGRRADGSSAREGGQMKQGLSITLCGESRASKGRSLGTHVGP